MLAVIKFREFLELFTETVNEVHVLKNLIYNFVLVRLRKHTLLISQKRKVHT